MRLVHFLESLIPHIERAHRDGAVFRISGESVMATEDPHRWPVAFAIAFARRPFMVGMVAPHPLGRSRYWANFEVKERS